MKGVKKRYLAVAALAVAAMTAGTTVATAQKEVRVYNWSDYIDEQVLKDFTTETGIKVVYDVFDSNDLLETKLLAGKTGYDVVVPTGNFLARQIQAGVFQKLDKSKLTNWEHLWPDIMDRLGKYDPGNEHAVNYMWGTTGIGYNVKKIKDRMPDAPVDSWRMVMDPDVIMKFKDCGIMMLDAPDEITAATLN
jgi:putrescine transport system substrate-binding protein